MKKLLASLVLICAVVNLGCEPQNTATQDQPRISGPSKPDETAKFPEIMVGVWETKANFTTQQKWGIKFERDGSVRKIIHYVAGPMDLTKGATELQGDDEREYALFLTEPCKVKYDPKTNMLEVEIIVESFLIQQPTFDLEGYMTDRFSGPISTDGKTWVVERRVYGHLEGTKKIPDEFADAHPDKLTFYKLDIARLGGKAMDQ